MNIFHKVALEGLKKSRTRTLVTIIGVVLSTAMFTAVSTFGVSLLNYTINGAILKYGDWHVEFPDVDPSFVQEQSNDNRVENVAAFENIGYATLEGGKNPDKPYLFIAGFDKEAFDTLPITLLSGRLPENSSEILVPAHVAANGGVQFSVGDTLTLSVGVRQTETGTLSQHDPYGLLGETLIPKAKKTYTVVGICQRPTFEERSAPGYTLITAADPAASVDSLSAFVTLKHPFQVHSYTNEVTDNNAYVLNDDVLRFMGLSNDKIFTSLLFAVGGIVIAIIMIGSIFLIYNAFNISLNERTHQFGILMSVGATAKQLRGSVLFEGLCIGIIGIPIGILIGIPSMQIVLSLTAQKFVDIMYDNVQLTLTVPVPVIAAAAIISLITILISAYIPAKKAAATPVMECIRQTNEVKVENKAMKTSRFASRIYGLEGTLALKNFKRNKRRYRSIILSLILSVVLFIATNSFIIDLKQSSEQAVVYTNYDICLGSLDMEDDQMLALYDAVKGAKGVDQSSYQAFVYYNCTVPSSALSEAYWQAVGKDQSQETVKLTAGVQFLDDDSYQKIVKNLGLPVAEYTGPNAKVLAVAVMAINDGRTHVIEDFDNMFAASSQELTIIPETSDGQNVELQQDINMTLAAFEPPDIPAVTSGPHEAQPYLFNIVVPWSLKDSWIPAGSDVDIYSKGLTFQSKTPTPTTSVIKSITEGMGITVPYTLMNMSRAFVESRNYVFIANVFAYLFIVMISLIAVANVFNTISTNIKMRRRELAMLRSVGMSDKEFNRMMRFECVFYGMRALLIGLPTALLCSWLIYKGMYTGGAESIDFVLPWGSICISIVSVLLIIFVTMMYSVNKIKKENIIDALRDEMT
ncbi:MAG: ABC transporter permease [Eubacteriales bacterium]|nr:ABC transporter permease [Eubacteriales bacterium]